jgi:orotate phosphoribosyltransferase
MPLDEAQALAIFKKAGAYLDGHFLLTSGRHSNAYVEKMQVLQHPELCGQLCAAIADKFRDLKPDVVVGPAIGGIILAYEVARALGVRGIFLEREDGKFTLRRGFEIGPDEKALLVEDIVTTGTSVFEMLDALPKEKAEGRLVGIGYLVDRSGGDVKFNVGRQEALMHLDLPTWDPSTCPLCKEGKPLTKRGSRKTA